MNDRNLGGKPPLLDILLALYRQVLTLCPSDKGDAAEKVLRSEHGAKSEHTGNRHSVFQNNGCVFTV